MKRRFAWAPLIGLGLVGAAAGETSRIERRDGSIVMRRGRGVRGRPVPGGVAGLGPGDHRPGTDPLPPAGRHSRWRLRWIRGVPGVDQRSSAAADGLEPQTELSRAVLKALDSPADATVG
jgi:hypothetical protein